MVCDVMMLGRVIQHIPVDYVLVHLYYRSCTWKVSKMW